MPDLPGANSNILPLPAEGHGSFQFWKKEILAAGAKRDEDFKVNWDKNVRSYEARTGGLTTNATADPQIVVPKDFANVEQKKAQLYFQQPKTIAKAMRPDAEQSAPLVQAILQFYLGPHRINASMTMGEVLFDVLCPAGLMCSKIGYEAVQDGMAQVPIQVPAPPQLAAPQATPLGAEAQLGAPSPGSILGLSAPPPPQNITIMRPTPRIISERYFWERISPARILIPDGFSGSNYDLAPWLGFEFELPVAVAARRYERDEDELKGGVPDGSKKLAGEPNQSPRSSEEKITGWEIWYKASLYDPKEKNPDKLRYMVILDGDDDVTRHSDSPYQRFDPQTGRLMLGMRGFPVHIGALRYVSDTAYPPSECTVGRNLVDELGRFRTQQALMRQRAISAILVDLQRIGGQQTLEKIRRGDYGMYIPVPSLDGNNPPMMEAVKPQISQDSYRGNDYINRDISEIWSFGPNQLGQEANESRSATEMSIAQRNASARLASERGQVLSYFAQGATKVLALLQLFQDRTEFVEIVGDDGVRRLAPWDKQTIASEYLIEAKPDSSAQIDVAKEREDQLKLYELLARDPNVQRVELLRPLLQAYDHDPARVIVTQLPPKGPAPASLAFSFKLEDLDVGNPNFPLVISIMQQSGYQIPPEIVQQMQQHQLQQQLVMAHAGVALPAGAGAPASPGLASEHPGAALKAERLNKHTERQSVAPQGLNPNNVQ